MKLVAYVVVFGFSILLILTSQPFKDYATTFVRKQCIYWTQQVSASALDQPKLLSVDGVTLTKYSAIKALRLENHGGKQLLYCDGFDLPQGLQVAVTKDGHSCSISGAPIQAQALTNAYIVTANQQGRSLAIVPILVNALVLRE